jgi:hypothetical protein
MPVGGAAVASDTKLSLHSGQACTTLGNKRRRPP